MSRARRVCVFSGSSAGARPEYTAAAHWLGQQLVVRGLGLVYGGAKVGLMGHVADAVLAGGGHVIGVIPEALAAKEIAHAGIQDLQIVATMHERKQRMADQADGFIALPGGLGTLEEVFEMITWAQLGIHAKPCGFLNTAGYYDALLAFLDHAAAEGFVRPVHRSMVLVDASPAALLDRFDRYEPPSVPRWLDRRQT